MKDKVIVIVCILVVVGIVIGVIFKYPSVDRTEERLKEKLKFTAKEVFETEAWMKGGVNPDTYVATLDDLKNKLGKDITMFEKYKCDMNNTKVELIVLKQEESKETNYKYNIVLDCEF